MIPRGSRAGWPTLLLAAMLALGLVGLTALLGRWHGRPANPRDRVASRSATDPDRRGAISERGQDRRDGRGGIGRGPGAAGLGQLPDGWLDSFRQAVLSWRRSTGPRRLVIDQVCLVPDVPSFFEAIAAWDERHFFPILIDEPAWTLPFLRAFRPARVVRYAAREEGRTASMRRLRSPKTAADRLALWQTAIEAVARAWSEPSPPDGKFPPGGSPPRGLGPTPPGLVLTAPDSPMLAGAVALAAGRFQPLVRLEPGIWSLDEAGRAGRVDRFGDVLSLPQAWRFARRLEGRVASVTPRYDQLGDDCDFLTIAGDWPFRYDNDAERGRARGIHALDDLIGRSLEGEPDTQGLNASRRRWAYAGRLLGDPAASVARAMGALFLRPAAALLWDTYDAGGPWSEYNVVAAADRLRRSSAAPGEILVRDGARADLPSWHRVVDPRNRFGFIWINSSGGPRMFAIPGGPGRPADVPGGFPSAVVMIHSFSAADPADPQTIAGRWLAQGAFVYYGSVNEPYLKAFRPPRLVAELVAAEVPLAAALRQGELESFGRPWRLVYLGDPLYRLAGASGAPDRLSPSDWRRIAPSYADWAVREVPSLRSSPGPASEGADSDDARLAWCQDAAIGELVASPDPDDRRPAPDEPRRAQWRAILGRIQRDRLDRRLRPIYEDVLIDVLTTSGDWDELHARLARIPAEECRPRVWQALETGAMAGLAQFAQDRDPARDFARALDLWDGVIRLRWPAGSEFPAQFTERVAGLVQADGSRRLAPWLDHLRRAGADLAARTGPIPHAASAVAAERARAEAKLGHGL